MNIERLFVAGIAFLLAIGGGVRADPKAGDSSDGSPVLATVQPPRPSRNSAQPAPIVKVTGGRIRGALLERGGAVFEGIPYARPPVGALRWREPMSVAPWRGVRDATSFGPICPQSPTFIPPAVARLSKEDCLYLNVWTPEWPTGAHRPVMVWIPGGGNFAGGILAGGNEADGESLARHGVVVVSLNYRLGSFGFFSHPALTRESPDHASGNQGILDQIAALKWVRDNISRFGGDPRKVTIFGESAGSHDVSVLMTTPLSKGLFVRAIAESGSVVLVGDPQTLSAAEERGRRLALSWTSPAHSKSLRELRALPAAVILKHDPQYLSPAIDRVFPNLGIVIDGHVFPRSPIEVFREGKEQRVALLHGSNALDAVPGLRVPRDLSAAIDRYYGPLAGRAEKLYGSDGSDSIYGTPADRWFTDTSFRCPAVAQLMWHAAAGNPSYEYEFAHVPPEALKSAAAYAPLLRAVFGTSQPGAVHASEVSYVFGSLDHGIRVFYSRTAIPATPLDRQVSDVMQRYWTNFAKTGDPNGGDLPTWPRFKPTTRAYIQFTSASPVAKEGLRRAQCDLFIENVKRLMANRRDASDGE